MTQLTTPAEAIALFKAAPPRSLFAIAVGTQTCNWVRVTKKDALAVLERANSEERHLKADSVRIQIPKEPYESYFIFDFMKAAS